MSRGRAARRVAWLLACWLGAAAGCSSPAPAPARVPVAVFAASSLTEAFQELAREFERAHPDVDLRLTFSGSQVLRLQLEQGAGADVFASANARHMQALVGAGLVARSERFASNELVVIVPTSNPAGVNSFADLTRARRIVIGTDNVPVGIYARQVLARAGAQLGPEFVASVRRHVVSEESNVRLVRAKVELGEADAAIVYRTDAVASQRVRLVAIPRALNVRASYHIGPATRSRHPNHAARFVAFVRADEGRRILGRHGFVPGVP